MYSGIKKLIKNKVLHYHEFSYEEYIRKSFKESSMKWVNKKLTPEQEREVQDFYLKHLGQKIDTSYHAYYYSRNNIFSPKYVPSSIYKARIVGRLNDMRIKDAYIDKNQYERLFPEINHPKTILKCVNGYYYQDNKPITKKYAVEFCSNVSDLILKPTLESVHGTKVTCVNSENGVVLDTGKKIEDLFDSYGNHFIVQERIKQHDLMSALNPTSVNTIRLLTYRRGNTIELLYAVVRIGRKGEIIDNESSGGITSRIDSDGYLDRYAYGSPSEGAFEKTDSGIIIDRYEIPSYKEVVDIVKMLHLQLPFFNLAGWDIAIGYDGNPLFVEWNSRTELSQTAVGPAFGDFTEEILNLTRTLATTRYYIIGQQKFNKD